MTAYDAADLELALHVGLPLATLDGNPRRVVQAESTAGGTRMSAAPKDGKLVDAVRHQKVEEYLDKSTIALFLFHATG